MKNAESLLIILGTIVIFITLSNVIFSLFKVSPIFNGILSSFLEMTSGIKKISELVINSHLKFILISMSLAFSGLSILMQAFSILEAKDIDVKFVLKNKLILLVLTFIIDYTYIVFFM